jgi:hypothetical protein
MDPTTGNILTAEEVEMLGKRMKDMIPLGGDQARELIAERQNQAVAIAERQVRDQQKAQRRKKNKHARKARKNNR